MKINESMMDGADLITFALSYLDTHSDDWEGSTVEKSIRELTEAWLAVGRIRSILVNTGSYADGGREDMDEVFRVIRRELRERLVYWTEPLFEEIGDNA